MPVAGFYFVVGDDTDMIERKWLADISKRYSTKAWVRLDATVDELVTSDLTTEYYSNPLFNTGTAIVIRNADHKHAQVFEFINSVVENPNPESVVILISKTWNKTTKFGKIVKKHFIAKEFFKPEIKPFDLLDSLNTKNTGKVLQQCNRLFEADYNPLAMFSLIFGHLLLLRQVKERERQSPENIARELKQHQYRVKKAMVANRFWEQEELDQGLLSLNKLGRLLRTWQYDEEMLLRMYLIKITL